MKSSLTVSQSSVFLCVYSYVCVCVSSEMAGNWSMVTYECLCEKKRDVSVLMTFYSITKLYSSSTTEGKRDEYDRFGKDRTRHPGK